MPKFGIIIPIYKGPHFIGWVVESLIAQTFLDWEAILIDDFSDDANVNLALDEAVRADGRIRVLHQSSNQGQSAARNVGLDHIKSDYVIFLDFDDILLPWSLELMNRVIQDEGEPAIVAGSAVPLTKTQRSYCGEQNELKARRFRDYFDYKNSDGEQWFAPSGVALKTADVRKVGGFWKTRVYFEDVDLWSRMGSDMAFVRVYDPPIYGYRLHDASAHHDWDRMYGGLMLVMAIEKDGGYPGGQERKKGRIRILAGHARHHAVEFVSSRPDLSMKIYGRAFVWNLTLGRWKFLFGLPFLAARGWLSDRRVDRKGV